MMFNQRALVFGPCDGDNIESHGGLVQVVMPDVLPRCPAYTPLLGSCDCRGRTSWARTLSGLYFDDDEEAALDSDQVQFSSRQANVMVNDPVTLPAEETGGYFFPTPP